ncbi:MAG: alpha/beta hydrolase [Solirubrobacterales bacterium]|nr:alpha/beta hydrolase [Solirubrobacterales bacterium]
MELWHDSAGEGRGILLLHAGICDAQMWERQMRTLAPAGRVVRCDLPGFGRTPMPAADYADGQCVIDLIEAEGLAPVVLVGASMGGEIALDVALARPDLVAGLVLIGSGHPLMGWTEELKRYSSREEDLAAAGDVDAIVELNLRFWVDGPDRTHDEVDAAMRAFVGDMQRDALVMLARPDVEGVALVPEPAERLGEIAVPTLAVVRRARHPRDARGRSPPRGRHPRRERRHRREGRHLPSLERPEEFDALVLGSSAACSD